MKKLLVMSLLACSLISASTLSWASDPRCSDGGGSGGCCGKKTGGKVYCDPVANTSYTCEEEFWYESNGTRYCDGCTTHLTYKACGPEP